MASCTKRRLYTFKSDASSLAYGSAVKIGSDNQHVAVSTGLTDPVLGFVQDDPTGDAAPAVQAVGDAVEVALQGGGAKALAGGTITRGNDLSWNGTGLVVASSGNRVCAVANDDAVLGDIFSVEVVQFIKP